MGLHVRCIGIAMATMAKLGSAQGTADFVPSTSDVVLSRWDWMWLTVFICIKKTLWWFIWLFPSSKSISKTHFLGKFHPTFHISIYFPYFMVSFGWVSSRAWCRITCQSLRPAGCSWWRIASSTPEPRFLGRRMVDGVWPPRKMGMICWIMVNNYMGLSENVGLIFPMK